MPEMALVFLDIVLVRAKAANGLAAITAVRIRSYVFAWLAVPEMSVG